MERTRKAVYIESVLEVMEKHLAETNLNVHVTIPEDTNALVLTIVGHRHHDRLIKNRAKVIIGKHCD